jgi:hypothetical protein
MAESVEAGETRALEARDSYGSHSGGGYGSYCPEGIPVELALLSILGSCLGSTLILDSTPN